MKGMGAGAVGSGIGGLFSKNPYSAASGSLNKIPGQVSTYYNPYIQSGLSANSALQGQNTSLTSGLPSLQSEYSSLMTDPSQKYNQIAGTYQQSPGYQWQYNQGMDAANQSAAAAGLAGSPANQQSAATMAEGLANQDFYNYMSHVLGMYGLGLQGSQGLFDTGYQGEQAMNKQGYNASSSMAKAMSDYYATQAAMKFAGQGAQNQSTGDMIGDMAMGAAMLMI